MTNTLVHYVQQQPNTTLKNFLRVKLLHNDNFDYHTKSMTESFHDVNFEQNFCT